MSEIDVNKYISGDLTHYTDPNTGITWHNAKFVQQLKQENERLKQECDLYKTWYRAKHDDLKNFLGQLKAENTKLKNIIKEMEENLDDWISDVSILYTYDDGKPNNLDELQCCMEQVHKEWQNYKKCFNEIKNCIECSNCKYDKCDDYKACSPVKCDEIYKLIEKAKESEE